MRRLCIFPGCGRFNHSHGYCNGHRTQQKLGKPLVPLRDIKHPRSGRVCEFAGCGKPHSARGYCLRHYQQHMAGKPLAVLRVHRPRGAGSIDSEGYRRVTKNGVRVFEHRWVMGQVVGRPLLDNENVHHKNGDRLDNRPENLELWSSSQPSGQRVEDKTAWAIEWLKQYQPDALAGANWYEASH